MSVWQPIDTAPRDGQWFYALRVVTLLAANKPWRALPEITVVKRERSSPDSDGYWMGLAGYSIADHVVGQMWAPLDALPMSQILEASETKRRGDGAEPFDLPIPFGSGLMKEKTS